MKKQKLGVTSLWLWRGLDVYANPFMCEYFFTSKIKMMCVKQPLNATTSCHLWFLCVRRSYFTHTLENEDKMFADGKKIFYDITFLMNFSTIQHIWWHCALQMVSDSSKNTFRLAFIICCRAMKNWFGSFYTFNTLKRSIINEQKIWHVVIYWFSNQTWKSLLYRALEDKVLVVLILLRGKLAKKQISDDMLVTVVANK